MKRKYKLFLFLFLLEGLLFGLIMSFTSPISKDGFSFFGFLFNFLFFGLFFAVITYFSILDQYKKWGVSSFEDEDLFKFLNQEIKVYKSGDEISSNLERSPELKYDIEKVDEHHYRQVYITGKAEIHLYLNAVNKYETLCRIEAPLFDSFKINRHKNYIRRVSEIIKIL